MYRKKMATPNNVVYALEKSLLFADPSLVEEEDLRDVALMAREDGELDCIDSEIHLVVERCSNVLFCCQQEESLAKEVKATILGQFLSDQQLTVEVLSTYFDLIMPMSLSQSLIRKSRMLISAKCTQATSNPCCLVFIGG
jgi:hypothetical protein